MLRHIAHVCLLLASVNLLLVSAFAQSPDAPQQRRSWGYAFVSAHEQNEYAFEFQVGVVFR